MRGRWLGVGIASALLAAPLPAQAQRRMAPIPPEKLTAEQKAAMEVYRSARGRELKEGIFMDLLRVPDAMLAGFRMRDYIQKRGIFGDQLTEFALLITLREWTQRQEWSGHAFIARRAGVSPSIIEAIAEGRYPKGMTDDQSILYDFTTELHRNHGVSDASYDRMVKRFGEAGVIEAITIATLYTMVGMTLNTVREPIPDNYNALPELPQVAPLPTETFRHPVPLGATPPPETPLRPPIASPPTAGQ